MKASIDLGTNTALLLILNDFGEVVVDRSTMVRLGKGVDLTKVLLPEAMERTLYCLKEYTEILNDYHVETSEVIAVTTATARDAKNGDEFFKKVFKETGILFKTLSGTEEAKASFLGGLLPSMKPEESLVFDLGGGSLEFQTEKTGLSLQCGSVRFTERFLKSNPVSDDEFWKCREAIDELLIPLKGKFLINDHSKNQNETKNLIGVAGTVVTLASLHLGLSVFDRSQIDGVVLSRGDLHRLVEELKWRNTSERLLMKGMEKGREDVILAGALITWRILEVLGFKEMIVSTRGLRYGVLLDQSLK